MNRRSSAMHRPLHAARAAACFALMLLAACGGSPVEGGEEDLEFEGGALDGSEDAALAAREEAMRLGSTSAGASAEGAPAIDAETEALAEAYLTMPIDEILESMGLARDEATQMLDLPDETIRQLAIARLRRDALDPDGGGPPERLGDGTLSVRFRHVSLDALDDPAYEAVIDALMEGEQRFPAAIAALDGKRVELTGYMIPVEWQRRDVTEFMLVRDLLACCFGGAPQPDEWVHVSMEEGADSPYYPFVPVAVVGTFQIEGIDDGSGYAAGAYRMRGVRTREL